MLVASGDTRPGFPTSSCPQDPVFLGCEISCIMKAWRAMHDVPRSLFQAEETASSRFNPASVRNNIMGPQRRPQACHAGVHQNMLRPIAAAQLVLAAATTAIFKLP